MPERAHSAATARSSRRSVRLVLEDARHVHAGARRSEVDEVLEHFRLFEERPPPLIVDRARLADVPREMPVADERCEHALCEQRSVAVCDVLRIDEGADERFGHDRVRDAQPRKQDLVEAADVDHASVRIHALERGDRPTFVAIVAVVVVFENVRLLLRRPVEQRLACVRATSRGRADTGAPA